MHTSFNFDYLTAPWDAAPAARGHRREHRRAGSRSARPATWVLSSHDETRHVTRFGRAYTGAGFGGAAVPASPADLDARRSAGPGRPRCSPWRCPAAAYLYQGEELGLPEVEDLPEDALQDPTWERSGHTDRGRDGCRVPLPWAGDRPPFGFTARRRRALAAAAAGLGGPDRGRAAGRPGVHAVAVPGGAAPAPGAARAARRAARPGVAADDDVLAFDRGPTFRCVVNLSARPVDLAGQGRVLLASGPCAGELPPDTAVWLSRPGEG